MGWRGWFGGKSARTTEDLLSEAEAARPPAPRGDPLDDITRLARSGEKIEAIKLYRDLHDVGLKEAKDAVDAIARGEDPAQGLPATPPAAGTLTDEDVRALIARDELIGAIKLYRELHEVGLKEAKDAVDGMR